MRLILTNSKRNLKESWEEPGEIVLGVFAGRASSVWRAGLEKTQHFRSYLCGLLLEGKLALCFHVAMACTMGSKAQSALEVKDGSFCLRGCTEERQ